MNGPNISEHSELESLTEGATTRISSRATLSLAEAAEILGIHRTTAWSLQKRGEFPVPVLKIGTSLRVVKAHLQHFIDTGQPVPTKSLTPQTRL